MSHRQLRLSMIVCLTFILAAFCTVRSMRIPRGAYIHIPFCRRRCFYCNFPVVVVGERPSSQESQGIAYTELLMREMKATLANTDEQLGELETVYFGGGTPSLLPVDCISQILAELKSTVGFTDNVEITLEMDPGTFDENKLTQIRSAGVNRLSLGVQSFDKEVLQKCGRAHTVEDVARALRLVTASEFKDNFSIDLISSLPGLTIELWQETLLKAANSGCSHISVYDLQVEDKTAFGRWYSPGVFPLPTDEQSALMYCRAAEVLNLSGFEHYEVSNYARPGKRSQHNQRYWGCKPTWGFGMGAASYINNNRYTRPDKMGEYSQWVDELEIYGFTMSTIQDEDDDDDKDEKPKGSTAKDIGDNSEESDDDDGEPIVSRDISSPPGSADILEVVMLALRTSDGLCLGNLGKEYGALSVEKVIQAVQPFVDRGLVTIRSDSGDDILGDSTQKGPHYESQSGSGRIPSDGRIRLTDPQGFLVSNDIISSVFVELTC